MEKDSYSFRDMARSLNRVCNADRISAPPGALIPATSAIRPDGQ